MTEYARSHAPPTCPTLNYPLYSLPTIGIVYSEYEL